MTMYEQALALWERTYNEAGPGHTKTRALEGYMTQHYGREALLAINKIKDARSAGKSSGALKPTLREYKPTVGKAGASPTPAATAKPAMKEYKGGAQLMEADAAAVTNSTPPQARRSQPKEAPQAPAAEASKEAESESAAGKSKFPEESMTEVANMSPASVMEKYDADALRAILKGQGAEFNPAFSHRQLANRLIRYAKGE